jgi:hypothetical protein
MARFAGRRWRPPIALQSSVFPWHARLLPLFGLSLLAFLLVDITVGAAKRSTVCTPITGKTN